MTVAALPPLLGAPLPIELMNTRWMRRGVHLDALEDAAGMLRWAIASGVGQRGAAAPDERELTAWRRLRDALRSIASEATADPRTEPARMPIEAATATLNAALAAHREPRRLAWRPGGPTVADQEGDGWAATRGRLAVEALELLTDPASRIRPCLAPNCPLFFVQTHPRKRWCSDSCGNRVRVARHAARAAQREPTSGAG